MEKPRIFVVDNEIEIVNLFRDFIDFLKYEPIIETDGEKVLRDLEKYQYDLLFVDLKLGDVSGVDILKKSKEVHPDAEVIVVTGYGSDETVLKTLHHGAFSYIQKPISFSEIKIQTEEALAMRRFNLKTSLLRGSLTDPAHGRHLESILNLDRLSMFFNLTIDIETLADTILTGIASILPGYFYSFLFFDDYNREMVIYSNDPIHKKTSEMIESHIKEFFENLVNKDITDHYRVRISIPSEFVGKDDGKNIPISSFFVPVLVDNAIKGAIGVSAQNLNIGADEQDMLKLISSRADKVLANATLHRNTKMLAITDGLTGLLNHRAFYDRMKQEFERFRRYGSYLSLIVADFDDLKKINDNYGHPVGDEVLRKIGDILRETSRESDVLARYGGDEFVILLPQTNAKNARNMAERIRVKVEAYTFAIQDFTFKSSMTIGVATVPNGHINSPMDLMEGADRALYEAKRSGKNRIVVADPTSLN